MSGPNELRRAAASMREQHDPDHPRHAMWTAMADWLDYVARVHTPVRLHVGNVTGGGPAQYADLCSTCPTSHVIRYPCDPAAYALAVASAYLDAGDTP